MARGRGGILAGAISGSVGGVTFQRQGDMVQVRERVRPRDPQTPLQMANRARMDDVAGLWAGLSEAEHGAWVRFAQGAGTLSAWAAFLGLTSKWMQLHPEAPWEGVAAPRVPPAGPFYGDNVRLTIVDLRLTGLPQSSIENGQPSMLRVVASQSNAAGVATEILVQQLPNIRRKPRVRDYRTAAVVAFEAGSLAAEIPLSLGPYAVAYRFVRPESGQATAVTALGAVTVA